MEPDYVIDGEPAWHEAPPPMKRLEKFLDGVSNALAEAVQASPGLRVLSELSGRLLP